MSTTKVPAGPPPGSKRGTGSGESECGCGWHRCRQCASKCVLVCALKFRRRLISSPLCCPLSPQSHPSDPDILNGIYMSEALNAVFVENFQRDPTLTWQYFGSSTGFFRIYPGEDSMRRLHSPLGSVSGNKVTLQPKKHTFK